MPRKKSESVNLPKAGNTRESRGVKGKNIPAAKIEKPPHCHIHDEVEVWEDVDNIRENVCVNDEPLLKHTDGKHYCLFHLPSKVKDIVKFEQIFQARLKAVEDKIAEIKKLPKDKQAESENLRNILK